MNRAALVLAVTCALSSVAAAETFDIVTFPPPSGFAKHDAAALRAFTLVDNKAGTFCRITLHASMATLGSAQKDFDADWRDLIAKVYKPTTAPKTEAAEAGGWKVTTGIAPFSWEDRAAVSALVMMTSPTTRFAISYAATGDCIPQLTSLVGSLQLAGSTATTVPPAATAPPETTTSGGWSLAALPDFVEARQNKFVVRLHYATQIPDGLRADPEGKRDHFWSTFVAPRYAGVKNVRKPRPQSYADSEMVEADALEIASKQHVHVAFHMFTASGVVTAVEVVAPSKQALDAAYADSAAISALRDVNRFAVAPKELVGTWSDSSGSFLQYYNVYTGNSAGLAIGASSYKVDFTAKGTFKSQLKAVAGRTGSLSFHKENQAGSFKLEGGALVTKSGGVTRRYHAWFEAVRGGRILHLVDQKKSGMHDMLIREN